jgi:hypothetical protein
VAKQLGLDMKEAKSGNGANLGFEEKMWKAADKLHLLESHLTLQFRPWNKKNGILPHRFWLFCLLIHYSMLTFTLHRQCLTAF